MDAQKPTKIFYQDSGYNIERNLLNLTFNKYEIERKIGIIKILGHLYYKLKGGHVLLGNTHWELFKKDDAIWHFFNRVSLGKTPWVVTYETMLPRWPGSSKKLKYKGIKALARDDCKKMIALSKCAKAFQIRYLQENFPFFTEEISKKITVIHPPQKQLLNKYADKRVSTEKLIFTIVGADFFRKGGKEILLVFDKLFKQNAPVELYIISTMKYGDYASKATLDDLKQAQAIINKYPNRIHYHKKLSHAKVMSIFKKSHVGLLPTYADTYGYSVLEAQACGCPVITTNIRALPEINNNNCGWVIEVPKDRWGNGRLDTARERAEMSDVISKRLYQIITDIISFPDQILKKGALSLKRIKEKHKIKNAAQKVEQIYDMSC